MAIVLEGSKEDDERWKRFSRQIVDVVFPQLPRLQVINNLTIFHFVAMFCLNMVHLPFSLFKLICSTSYRNFSVIYFRRRFLQPMFQVFIIVCSCIRKFRLILREIISKFSNISILWYLFLLLLKTKRLLLLSLTFQVVWNFKWFSILCWVFRIL